MVQIPIFGALALASGTILEKMILRRKTLDIRLYQVLSFLAIIAVMVPFIWFFWHVDSEALEVKNIIIFGIIILFSIIANILTFYSMKWEKITNLEPARILEPLFVVLLAILFSFFAEGMYDRNANIIIPALLSASALIFSHVKKHHLDFNKYFMAAIFGSLFFAMELVTSRLILEYYSSLTFYFIRCLSVFIISIIIFHPRLKGLDKKVKWQIFIVAAIWVIYRVIIYYGYVNMGVIFTTLIIMIAPVFVYIFAWKFLKERLDWKNILAAIIIIGSVLYALLS
jgi:drug/metabolite transporter (DMT)-like permease